jgi:DNA replication and repair protein RecF
MLLSFILRQSYFNPLAVKTLNTVKSFFVIDAEFIKNERNEQVVCSLKKVKSIKAQWQSLRQIFRPCRFYSLGIISPADRDLIVEGSETRRKFMDSVISQLDSQYLQHLIQYQKVQSTQCFTKIFRFESCFENDLAIYNEQLDGTVNIFR